MAEYGYVARHRLDLDGRGGGAVALRVGQRVGDRYDLLHRIEGDTPRYKAYDTRLNRPVTVTATALDPATAELITGSDGRLAASSLAHPALEALLDVGQDQAARSAYLVTGYETSTPLEELSPSAVLGRQVLEELAGLLAYLHGAGVGHAGLTARRVRRCESEAGTAIRAPFTGLYRQSDTSRPAEEDIADVAALVLGVWQPAAEPSTADRVITQLLLDMAKPSGDRPSAVEVLRSLGSLRPVGAVPPRSAGRDAMRNASEPDPGELDPSEPGPSGVTDPDLPPQRRHFPFRIHS